MASRACPACGVSVLSDVEVCPACIARVGATDADSTRSSPIVDVDSRSQIGPYRILERIGEGGMGVVFLAQQESPIRRRVALKLIKLGMDTRQVLARFEAERQALALMDHPSIAVVFDAGTTVDGRSYFVMEYVLGVPITDYCDRHRLPIRARLELFSQVCSAIQHAHHRGVIHRDVKPSNVLVTIENDRPVPKIIDFGLAKAMHQRLTERTIFTEHGALIGTPAYMSPEQAEMTGLNVDTRTDIYSLGVLLYELLVGAVPFDAKRLREAGYAEIQRIIRDEEPTRPSTRFSGLGDTATEVARQRQTSTQVLTRELRGDLDWITLKALEKDRTRRYSSASELAADVERHLRDEPVVARPPSTTYRVRKFAKRHRAGVLVGATTAVALVAGLVLATTLYFRAEDARQRAEYQAYVATLSAAQADLDAEDVVRAERRLIAVSEEYWSNWEWRYLYSRTDMSVATLIAQEDSSTISVSARPGLAISPDGRRVFLATRHLVQSWELEKGVRSVVFSSDRRILAISPDGDAIVTAVDERDGNELRQADREQPLEVVDLATGTIITTLRASAASEAAFDASGDQIATHAPKEIAVWSVRSGERIASTLDLVGFRQFAFSNTGDRVFQSGTIWEPFSGTETKLQDFGKLARSMAFSPDGARIVIMDAFTGLLREWDTQSGTLVRVLAEESRGNVTSLAFSPDGRFVAAGELAKVQLWDMSTGKVIFSIVSDFGLESLVFSSDGRRLVGFYGRAHPYLRVWDMNGLRAEVGFPVALGMGEVRAATRDRTPVDSKLEAALRLPRLPDWMPAEPRLFRARAVSGDGRHLALAMTGHVGVWNLDSQTLVRQVAIDDVSQLVLADDATRALVGTTRGALYWSKLDDRPPTMLSPSGVTSAAISPDGALAVAGYTKGVTVWDLSAGRELVKLDVVNPVRGVRVDSQSRKVVVLTGVNPGEAVTLEVWHLDTQQRLRDAQFPNLEAFAVSPDGTTMAASWSDPNPSLQIFDVSRGMATMTMNPLGTGLRPLTFSRDGRRIAHGTDGSIHIWDVATGVELLTLRYPGGFMASLQFSRDGARLLALGPLSVRVYNAGSPYFPGARDLVERLYDEVVFSQDVVGRLRSMAGISSRLRAAAIALAEAWGDSPARLTGQSQAISQQPGQSVEAYRRALTMSELAVKLDQRSSDSLLALGMAQYRNGDYEKALMTLRSADKVGPSLTNAKSVFLAMAYTKLGQLDSARVELQTLRNLPPQMRDLLAKQETLGPPRLTRLFPAPRLSVLRLEQEAEALLAKAEGR